MWYILGMTKRNINQKSIAKSLNLSVATVSKALSDYADVNSTTRDKVVNMATKMGYKYRSGSKEQSGSERKNYFVGVLIHSNPDEVQHTTYFAGMTEKCAKLNVSLILNYFSTSDCELVLDPEYQPPVMRDGELSGIILVNRWPIHVVKRLAAKTPCVSIIHQVHEAGIDVVGIDDHSGIAMLMDHLIEHDHRRIGFFGRCGSLTWSRNRFAAYVNSLCRIGIEYDAELICDVPMEKMENKSQDLDEQIEYVSALIGKGVRSWMCSNDLTGYVLCRGLLDRGFRIPEDVSITGFDNHENNHLGCPELTSTKVPALKIGAESLRRLMTRLRHLNAPQLDVKLQCKLVEGATTGPLLQDV